MKIRAAIAAFALVAIAPSPAWATSPIGARLTAPAPSPTPPATDTADVSIVALAGAVATNAANARKAPFRFEIRNDGPGTAMNLTVEVDLSKVDSSRVTVSTPTGGGCSATGRKVTCRFEGLLSKDTLEFTLPVHRRGGGPGSAGSLAVTAKARTPDPTQHNNAAQVALETGDPRFTLVAVASDVYGDRARPPSELSPVPSGSMATLQWFLVNDGPNPRRGIVYSIQLPEHVTFAGRVAGCEYSTDNRRATCTDPGAVLGPAGANGYSVGGTRVVVAPDAPEAALAGGSVSAYATEDPAASADPGPHVKALTDAQRELIAEVPPNETTARYAVHVGPAEGFLDALRIGSLSSGVSIALLGTVGLVVLGAGTAMLLFTRRRLILVAPDERTPDG